MLEALQRAQAVAAEGEVGITLLLGQMHMPGCAQLAREVKIELVERALVLLDRGSAAPFANAKVTVASGFGFAKGEARPATDAQGRVVLKLPAGDYALTIDGGTVSTPVHWSAQLPAVTTLRL